MACAPSQLGQNEYYDEVPMHLYCKICYDVPKTKVFQCTNGHCLCESCYQQIDVCPTCRIPFNKDEPMRARFLEDLLDQFVKVDCAYYLNGCCYKPTRESVETHQPKCYFNVKRFGKLINLCKLLGFKDCDFRCNNGNEEMTVQHFESVHGCVLAKSDHLQLKLIGFRQATEADSNEVCCWDPVISDLKTKDCFLLLSAIFNRKVGSIFCVAVIIPKLNELLAPLQILYGLDSKDYSSGCGSLQNCIALSKIESHLPSILPCHVLPQSRVTHFTEDGSLLINCVVGQESQPQMSTEVQGKDFEMIECNKRPTHSFTEAHFPVFYSNRTCACGSCNSVITEPESVNPEDDFASSLQKTIDSLADIVDEGESQEKNELLGTGIFVSNFPDNVTNERIKEIFTKYGEVSSIGKYVLMGDVYRMPSLLPEYLRFEDMAKIYVEFSDCSSVAKVMERKRQIFMRTNGKKRRLTVTTTENVQIYTPEKEELAENFFKAAKEAYHETGRNAVTEYVYKAFLFEDPVVFKIVTRTMASLAAECGSLESLKYCVEKGVHVNLLQIKTNNNKQIMSLLGYTMFDENDKIGFEKAKYLVECGADIHYKNNFDHTLLHGSIYSSPDAVKFFLEKGLDVNARNIFGCTPLHLALFEIKTQIMIEKIKHLLEYGADLSIKDNDGRSPWTLIKDAPVKYRDELKEMFRKHLQRTLNIN